MSSSSSCSWTKKEWPADFEDPNAGLPKKPDRLAITSRPDPFWHTTRGKALTALVITSIIGAIVWGAIGGARAISHGPASTSASSAQSQVVQKTTHASSVVVPASTLSSNSLTTAVPEQSATGVEGIPIPPPTSRPVGRAFVY